MKTTNCYQCQKEIQLSSDKVGYREECPFCHADIHSCRGCEFYDPKVYNECRETSADRVKDKEKSNFCDFFQVRLQSTGVGGESSGLTEQQKLLAAAEALFKKS